MTSLNCMMETEGEYLGSDDDSDSDSNDSRKVCMKSLKRLID